MHPEQRSAIEHSMADAAAILGILKCVSRHYDLDYADLLNVCNIHKPANSVDNALADLIKELEFISVARKGYLYHPQTNHIYSTEKKPQHIGHLCKESYQVILK